MKNNFWGNTLCSALLLTAVAAPTFAQRPSGVPMGAGTNVRGGKEGGGSLAPYYSSSKDVGMDIPWRQGTAYISLRDKAAEVMFENLHEIVPVIAKRESYKVFQESTLKQGPGIACVKMVTELKAEFVEEYRRNMPNLQFPQIEFKCGIMVSTKGETLPRQLGL